MIKSTKNLKEEIKDILTKRESAINFINSNIESYEEKINTINEKIENSYSASSIVEESEHNNYLKAIKAKEEALHVLDLERTRLEKLNDEPLISRNRYEEVLANVYAEQRESLNNAEEKAKALVRELVKLSDDMRAELEETNSAINEWQDTIYRSADRHINKNGDIMFLSCDDKRISNNTICILSDYLSRIEWATR